MNDVEYSRQRRRKIAAGTWEPRVPAINIQAHIEALHRANMSNIDIARAAGVAPRTLWSVLHKPGFQVQAATAKAILAVQPAQSPKRLPANKTHAVGAIRRIQALVVIGYSYPDMSRHSDITGRYLCELANGKHPTITNTTHRLVADLYNRLSGTPGPSRMARNLGRRNQWAPPLAWDNIDDPNETPTTSMRGDDTVDEVAICRALAGEPVKLTRLERHHAVHVGQQQGMTLTLVATRLGLNYGTAKSIAARPLPGGYELAA